jgi:hypothetical protein
MPPTTTVTATTLATAIKVKGNIWVTWQLLAAVGEDDWWRWIFLSLSADFLNRFLLAYFLSFPLIASTMRMVVIHPC